MLFALRPDQFALTFLTTLILFGYVSTWYRALSLAPVTLVATVLTLATLITNGLSAIFVTQQLTLGQVIQFILLLSGIGLFVKAAGKVNIIERKKIASESAV